MAVKFHPADFQKLANFSPERLQECGGITAPALGLIHDYACHRQGYEPGTACLVYLQDAPTGWIFFGDLEAQPCAGSPELADGATHRTRVMTSCGADAQLYVKGSGAAPTLRPTNLNPLYRDEVYLANSHLQLSGRIGLLFGGRRLVWPGDSD